MFYFIVFVFIIYSVIVLIDQYIAKRNLKKRLKK